MGIIRAWLGVSVLALSVTAVGCGGDDEETPPEASPAGVGGSAGAAGTAGASGASAGGKGGTSGAGGASGTGGTGGAGGAAGTGGTGGAAGSSGSAGTGGNGGATAGAAGESGAGGVGGEGGAGGAAGDAGSAGAAGDAGSAGAAGNPGGPLAKATLATSGATPFLQALDAVPSPDGSTIYFTAITANGGAGVFKVSAAGGDSTEITSGGPLVSPIGIAINAAGDTLFLADPGAAENPVDVTKDGGQVFVVSTAGGTAEALKGLDGLAVRGLEVAKETPDGTEQLFLTGFGSDGIGVYKTGLAGGAPSIVSTGGAFVDPSGIAVSTDGKVYVADTIAGGRHGQIIVIEAGTASVFADGLWIGYPAGLALSQDAKTLYASARTPGALTNTVLTFDTGTKAAGTPFAPDAVKGLVEAGGMHRAPASSTTAWVDGLANGTGAVFALTP
jgi:hypothetical protein